jgi:hypothetical protein
MTPMKALKYLPALAASAMLIASSGAIAANYGSNAQSNAPAATTKSAPATKTAKARSPESIQCSQEADAKGLHGKDRVKFRSACKTALRAHKPIPDVHKS